MTKSIEKQYSLAVNVRLTFEWNEEQPPKQRGGGGLKGIRLKNKGGLGGKLPHK